jgi:hypothetical protein
MAEDYAEKLLRDAAEFIYRDQGSRGFLERFVSFSDGDLRLASHALDDAMAARERAGSAMVLLQPGELRLETTSSGASLAACALAGTGGRVVVSVRLCDTDRLPIAGAVLRVAGSSDEQVAVTNRAGQVEILIDGPELRIETGSPEPADAVATPGGAREIALPRRHRRNDLTLAAAHRAPAYEAGEIERWRVVVGQVEFWCLDREGGYDLTILVTAVPAAFADQALGSVCVDFTTWNQADVRTRWIVPLGPSPRGLAGSLYGTDAERLDASSVQVGGAAELLGDLDDEFEDVVGRSVWHAETNTAWLALSQRLPSDRHRSAVQAVLARRQASS